MKRIKSAYLALAVAATLPIAVYAQDKKPVSEAEMKYQAGFVAARHRADVSIHQSEGTANDPGGIRYRAQDVLPSAALAAMVCCARARPANR